VVVAVWKGRVYVATGDCRLVAIDAARGTPVWGCRDFAIRIRPGSTDAPRVARGKVFIGYNGSDDDVRGSLVAFDAETGKEVWRFWTVPGDPAQQFESKALESAAKTLEVARSGGSHGGGDVWNAVDVLIPTRVLLLFCNLHRPSRGGYLHENPPPGGRKLFSGSIVAVNADTGEYVWHFSDQHPGLATGELSHCFWRTLVIHGQQRHVALTVPRRGGFYILDAKTGELLSQKPLEGPGVAEAGRAPISPKQLQRAVLIVRGCITGGP